MTNKEFKNKVESLSYPRKSNPVTRGLMLNDSILEFTSTFLPQVSITFDRTEVSGFLGTFDDDVCNEYINVCLDMKNALYDAAFENIFAMDFRIFVLSLLDWLRARHLYNMNKNRTVEGLYEQV